MATETYLYSAFTSAGGAPVDGPLFASEIAALSLPTAVFLGTTSTGTIVGGEDAATVETTNALAGSELTAVDAAVAAHVPGDGLTRAKASAKTSSISTWATAPPVRK